MKHLLIRTLCACFLLSLSATSFGQRSPVVTHGYTLSCIEFIFNLYPEQVFVSYVQGYMTGFNLAAKIGNGKQLSLDPIADVMERVKRECWKDSSITIAEVIHSKAFSR